MHLFTSIAGLRCYLDSHRFGAPLWNASEPVVLSFPAVPSLPVVPKKPAEIGLVPTMGALHAGHLSLIQRARRENKLVVVSLFVNPLQFGPTEDLERYPRTLEQDRTLCEQAGVDVLFVPSAAEMGAGHGAVGTGRGGSGHGTLTQVIPPQDLIAGLCGRSRTGHFQGVATIVTKLLNIVQPDRAYFGQKDAQQLAVIRKLAADLNLAVEIVPCPIVRQENGLALSSRNQYLSATEQEQAVTLYRSLGCARKLFAAGERLGSTLIEAVKAELSTVSAIALEYVELVDPNSMETLNEIKDQGLLAIAARLGSTRLIDNLLLTTRKPIVAIDGPAGAGKSTVARLVAQKLGLFYLDTGAMYRAFTWLVLNSGVAVDDQPQVAELISQCQIEFKSEDAVSSMASQPTPMASQPTPLPAPTIWVNGQEVTQAIRSLEVTSQVSAIAAQSSVRQALVKQQQAYGQQGGIVVEGRDIGTHVFPDAELKIFLTASVQERARRRQQDLIHQGIADINLDELQQAISDRDLKDSTRVFAPLRKATDAIELITDGLTIEQVTEQIVQFYLLS